MHSWKQDYRGKSLRFPTASQKKICAKSSQNSSLRWLSSELPQKNEMGSMTCFFFIMRLSTSKDEKQRHFYHELHCWYNFVTCHYKKKKSPFAVVMSCHFHSFHLPKSSPPLKSTPLSVTLHRWAASKSALNFPFSIPRIQSSFDVANLALH